MIQLRSVLKPADNTGVKKLRVVLVHGGFKRQFGHIGDVVTASVIETTPEAQFKKGAQVKAVLVRTKAPFRRLNGSRIRFDDNAAVILESPGSKNPAGTRIFGPVAREIREIGYGRIASLAQEVV